MKLSSQSSRQMKEKLILKKIGKDRHKSKKNHLKKKKLGQK